MAFDNKTKTKVVYDHGPLGFIFFVAWVGAFVYFLQGIKGFGDFLWAFLEACVWPGIVMYHVLGLLGA